MNRNALPPPSAGSTRMRLAVGFDDAPAHVEPDAGALERRPQVGGDRVRELATGSPATSPARA